MKPRLALAAILLATVGLSPAAAALFGGWGWHWEESIDRITDETHRTATAIGTEPGIFRTDSVAAIVLQCVKGVPAITFLWNTKVTTRKDWKLEYRFAGEPGNRLKAVYRNGKSQIVADLSDIRSFLSEAARSNNLYVRVVSARYGTHEATFKPTDGPATVARLVKYCPDAAPR